MKHGAHFFGYSYIPLFFQLLESIPKEFQWWTQSSLQLFLNSPACELTKLTNKPNGIFSKTNQQATSCTAFLSLSTTSWQVSIAGVGENVESENSFRSLEMKALVVNLNLILTCY